MQDDHTLLHLDSRRAGVELPQNLLGQHSVTLKLSYRFQVETTHDDTGIMSYLRFSGQYVRCVMPWTAVWGMSASDNRRTIWPEDIPKEVIFEMAKSRITELGQRLLGRKSPPVLQEVKKEAKEPQAEERKEAKLELVESTTKESTAQESKEPKAKSKPPLTRIK